MDKDNDYTRIVAMLERYFDLIYHGDASLIDEVFLPEARVYSVVDDQVVDIDVSGFHSRIANRPAPAATGEKRSDRILSIDITGPGTALAKVDLFILPAGHYTDYLSLFKVGNHWRIIAKVFHFLPADTGSARLTA